MTTPPSATFSLASIEDEVGKWLGKRRVAKGRQAFVQRLSMAEMAEAEKAVAAQLPVIAFTFLVETPCTYISASVATSACLGAPRAFKEFGREAAVAVLGTRSSSLPLRSQECGVAEQPVFADSGGRVDGHKTVPARPSPFR